MPVHDGDQIQEPAPHRQVGDIGAPDLIGPIHPQPFQQVGIGLVPFRRPAGFRLLIDRHQPHEAHQSAYPLLVHEMPIVTQVPGHLPDTEEGCFQELLVDPPHQIKVLRGLALRRLIE